MGATQAYLTWWRCRKLLSYFSKKFNTITVGRWNQCSLKSILWNNIATIQVTVKYILKKILLCTEEISWTEALKKFIGKNINHVHLGLWNIEVWSYCTWMFALFVLGLATELPHFIVAAWIELATGCQVQGMELPGWHRLYMTALTPFW